jgi:hypothetical protein
MWAFFGLFFHWSAGVKTSNLLTTETSRNTGILKVDIVINIFNT